MQVQKDFDNRIESYELYKKRTPASVAPRTTFVSKYKKLLILITIAASLTAVLVLSVIAVNVAFDNTVYSTSPAYLANTPDYPSQNAAFDGYSNYVSFSVINRGGDELILSSEASRLGEVLQENNIFLDATCVLNYTLDTTVCDGMQIVIDSITYSDRTASTQIPYETETIELQTIPKGTVNVLTKGEYGTTESVYRQKFVNGVFDSEELLRETVTSDPVTEVVERGVGGTFIGGDGVTYSYSYYLDVEATCYGEADGSGSITATGTRARVGVIAVDPNVIDLGSKVYVTGPYRDLGVCYAEDTGGFIKGNRIDVYLEGTLQQLLEFGRRPMRVYILD